MSNILFIKFVSLCLSSLNVSWHAEIHFWRKFIELSACQPSSVQNKTDTNLGCLTLIAISNLLVTPLSPPAILKGRSSIKNKKGSLDFVQGFYWPLLPLNVQTQKYKSQPLLCRFISMLPKWMQYSLEKIILWF